MIKIESSLFAIKINCKVIIRAITNAVIEHYVQDYSSFPTVPIIIIFNFRYQNVYIA